MNLNGFELISLRGGSKSIRSIQHGETMHIGTDPVTEATELHVFQQQIGKRLASHNMNTPFVVWDVGLGPAANALAILKAVEGGGIPVELHSFEIDTTVLEFALGHAAELGYLSGRETLIRELLDNGEAHPSPSVIWKLHRGDFSNSSPMAPSPSSVLFDPYSPARNPEMWGLSVFRSILDATEHDTPCLLTNYTRSTAVRVTMLLAGWYVGRGVPTGDKEETTIASSQPGLLEHPLDAAWLSRVRSSTNSSPLLGRDYVRGPIAPDDYASLIAHPQFSLAPVNND